MIIKFDAANHEYTLDGISVPSVTQVLDDVIPGWHGSDRDMALGSANHACYAMLARLEDFDADPECIPYCKTWKRWQSENGVVPVLIESQVGSKTYQYAGTVDLVAMVNGTLAIVDYKATITPQVKWQLAAYSKAIEKPIKVGVGVEIRPDGYRMEWFSLARAMNEWLGLLTAYRVRRECGIKERSKE